MTTRPTWLRTPAGTPRRISFGADYNPEQWPRDVWTEDVRLMQEAGVDVVSVGIFSWAHLQPAADRWTFGWLDDVLDLLHDGGIGVDLATATASPPPWLTTAHPEVLPVTRDGAVLTQGARQHWRPTSPVFRRYALALTEKLAQRYADHPALVAWHVNNELGCHNVHDYSDDAAAAFRAWLARRYGDVEALNHAWGTAFWSQRYGSFDEVLPPRRAASHPNPGQQLDFARFSSDALRDHLVAEREVLRRHTPDVPVTTNFMVMGETRGMDYASWASEVDLVANDHYVHPGPQARDELSFSASLTGGLAGGLPWFLMEHSTSAVNWQPVNVAKRPGEMARDSLAHVAHGADAVCFFQWRQSSAGAEKYHSGMVPHAGSRSRLFRDVVSLGRDLRALDAVAGSHRVTAPVAILFDWESWWASELDSHPTDRLRYRAEALDWWTALVDAGVRADVVPAGADLSPYAMVLAPVLHVVPQRLADRLDAYVRGGGHLVTTYFSGIVDDAERVWLGGYPGAFRDLLGIRVEEFGPLPDGETLPISTGGSGSVWSEPVDVIAADVEVLARYAAPGVLEGPAVTWRPVGRGSAAYVSTRLDAAGRGPVLAGLLERAGVVSELPEHLRGCVELTRRRGDGGDFWFLLSRSGETLDLGGVEGTVLLGGPDLAAGGVAVVRR
ncbi:beta-galactosidase [Cellulomonas sp. C5510]|uniref:beta-galactosidase n=1 Tax=Cellulomonas sp. C5510 TaxID=2871170 RepID=UPI001C95D92F|nr:beta-galactosidase [Cellulomonas sp. C5510]QZN85397.1 beta-galactosidase [Cellulomonas sp. C5510]